MRHVWNIGLTTAVALLILGGCTAAGTDGGNEDDDGETSTLSIVKDISTGSSSSNPGDLVVYGGELYFSAAEGSARMLWKTDGTNPGTVVASDFGVGMGLNPSPEDLAVHDGALYMGATSGSEQQELHSYTDSG
ncbi:MAG TPA: hypothetical protein VKA06_05205, partial [Spirochaetia bacterium]|nr:hypothetical protein [Spirochaetia bacterium]